jgi:hypothetical protein
LRALAEYFDAIGGAWTVNVHFPKFDAFIATSEEPDGRGVASTKPVRG